MKATDDYRQKLVAELIEQSARIDVLVINFRADDDQELEALRIQQQETTKKLQALEEGGNAWKNIGDGG